MLNIPIDYDLANNHTTDVPRMCSNFLKPMQANDS